MTDVKWGWMQTYTGQRFTPMDPNPDHIHLEDIAHGLSLLCRFNGQIDSFYSVAEHSVLVSEQFTDRDTALYGLLHDGTEAYVGDMITPLKQFFPEYKRVENKVADAIAARFGLTITPEIKAAVKEADTRILLTERNALMPRADRWELDDLVTQLPVRIEGWAPEVAERRFLDLFEYLTGTARINADPADVFDEQAVYDRVTRKLEATHSRPGTPVSKERMQFLRNRALGR
ncbi:hypothetical protein [Leifsonia sp. Leaf264]|uniref:hypothetical protein n=1 Tax=Leifsonia sp. Leaf264 TaxID=1736314 RepID=UPI0007010EFA|nr:hypothetical protein [Leifsonia sp. Leaf264]KQO98372.1 hypothetical protein ASF30_09945 [Leifsonia sp. Leaf264]